MLTKGVNAIRATGVACHQGHTPKAGSNQLLSRYGKPGTAAPAIKLVLKIYSFLLSAPSSRF